MNGYRVRIHENPEPAGLKLEDLERRLVKYLEKKKSRDPVRVNGVANYALRNGLVVNLYPRNGTGVLEMLVAGDMEVFARSINSIMRIYGGYIEIGYLQPT
ncbi:hypothetical protein HY637_00430 [Candidatus Woesearchaeota archaeon]|nr:hypothetical protein [Candidatus Woesearchaeota archaeon]